MSGDEAALDVEFAELATAEAVRDEWTDLLDRALEPNIFAEPAFALAAAQHFAEAQRPVFILVRDRPEGDGARGALLGVWPVEGRASPASPGFVRGWCCPQAVLGAPVIDRSRAAEVADAVLAALARRHGSRSLLLVPQLPRAGPTYGLLISRALATGREWGVVSSYARAVLRHGGASTTRRPKDLKRKQRWLEAFGPVAFRSASTVAAIREATEQFLALESSGWKGRRATALLSDAGSVTFARSMIRQLAAEGCCRIDSLDVAGNPVAMNVVLNSRGRAYLWKTAFDERYADASPGLLLALESTERQLEDQTVAVTDSCAVAGHPMIERVWNERQEMVDLAIAVSANAGDAARAAIRRERLRRRTREYIKRVVRAAKPRALRALRAALSSPVSAGGKTRRP